MSTSCQQIYVRARNASPANAALTLQPRDVLDWIAQDQQSLFSGLSGLTRDRFQTSVSITSSIGVANRVFDLSTLSLPVERILTVTLSDGREAHQVDVMDVDAELSPRYVLRGKTLIEVGNDWLIGSGSVTATLVYVYGPSTIDPTTSDYTQLVTVPDEWTDLLVLPLQMRLAKQRPPAPGDDMVQAQLDAKQSAFVNYLTNYGGIASTRFQIPTPATGNGKK